jgi:methionine-rich copper-binding protein CopC
MRKLLATLAMLFFTIFSINSALAHSQILSTFPDQNSNVVQMPAEVWIQFEGNLQTLGGKALNTIEVIDSNGAKVSTGNPLIEGGKISTNIEEQNNPGIFTVNYRIVGEDGHPVEGSYTFNLSPNIQEAVPVTSLAPEKSSDLSIGGIIMIVFLGLFIIGVLVKRKNEKK